MKSLFIKSLWAVAVAAALIPASVLAQNVPKIAVVDLKRVFDGYWKTKQADANIKDRAADFDKSRKSMIEDYQKANDDYKKLIESANDQAVSADEREKRKRLAELKLNEIKDIETQVNAFDRQTRANLGEQQRRWRDNIVREIREVVNAKAKAGAYNIVLDSTGETITGTPFLLFNSGATDLSDEVIATLNVGAPVNLPKTDAAEKVADPKKDEKKSDKK